MKLLFRKEQDEILKRIAACQLICNTYVKDIEAYTKMTENLAEFAGIVGACSGINKVMNTVHKYNE